MAVQPGVYPVQFHVDYPDRLSRLTTAFRVLLIIPIVVVLTLLGGGSSGYDKGSMDEGADGERVGRSGGGDANPFAPLLVVPPLLMILFRRKYPRWWFDWNVALLGFTLRVAAYGLLLRDEYPSTDEEQAVHLEIAYPNVETELHRFLPLVKWLLAIPHYVVLAFLAVGTVLAVVAAWFAILFTARYPRGLFDFVVGVQRWWLRVVAYALLMTTDKYPPFRLST